MAIGMEQCSLIEHNPYMTPPENQIATTQAIEIIDQETVPELILLHISISR
jgi:hypothetical protein